MALRPAAGEELEAGPDDDTALLMLPTWDYRTGCIHDMARLTRVAHALGALA